MAEFPVSIVRGMAEDFDKRDRTFGALNDVYKKYYGTETAEEGVLAIAAAGRYFVNGIALPSCEAEAEKGFFINDDLWLKPVEGGWSIGARGPFARTIPAFRDALTAMMLEKIPNGIEFLLYDDNGDGFADRIVTHVFLNVQANIIRRNEDGTLFVSAGDFPKNVSYPERFRPFIGPVRLFPLGEHIRPEYFDSSIQPGDQMMYYKAADGEWHFIRAQEIRGVFDGGHDHSSYIVDGKTYLDAMKYPRSMLASNRCGGFANIMNFFGFAGNKETPVSMWLDPVSEYATAFGAPIGFQTYGHAKTFLQKAIEKAEKTLDAAWPSDDGSDAPAGKKWISKRLYQELEDCIKMARDTLAVETWSTYYDYQTYMLFVTLEGTLDDISAAFLGFDFEGFNRNTSEYYTVAVLEGKEGAVLSEACPEAAEITAAGESFVNHYRVSEGLEINGLPALQGNQWHLVNGAGRTEASPEAAAAALTEALAGVPGWKIALQARTGEKTVSRISAEGKKEAVLARTGGNFIGLELYAPDGSALADDSGKPVRILKKYAPKLDHNRSYPNIPVIYWNDANYGGGEWVLEAPTVTIERPPMPPR